MRGELQEMLPAECKQCRDLVALQTNSTNMMEDDEGCLDFLAQLRYLCEGLVRSCVVRQKERAK